MNRIVWVPSGSSRVRSVVLKTNRSLPSISISTRMGEGLKITFRLTFGLRRSKRSRSGTCSFTTFTASVAPASTACARSVPASGFAAGSGFSSPSAVATSAGVCFFGEIGFAGSGPSRS